MIFLAAVCVTIFVGLIATIVMAVLGLIIDSILEIIYKLYD
jgi:hypothetical protein